MRKYTKEEAISIVASCAKKYRDELAGRSLLFVCMDKHKHISCIEFTFDASNYLHLTGLKLKDTVDTNGQIIKLSATDFYRKCLTHRLRADEFDFAEDGTTMLKLDVLPYVMNKSLSAGMIGDYNSANPKLYTEKLVGSVKACVGFVSSNQRYVPNTVLQVDIRDYTSNTVRVIAVFRKLRGSETYEELTYKAKKVEWEKIDFPEEFAYLSALM